MLKKRKKNGAHEHCSLFSETQTSKYSRHVVLCKYNKNTPSKYNQKRCKNSFKYLQQGVFLEGTKIHVKKKKNGAHKHLSHLKKLRASKYSRHVFFCPQNNKEKNQRINTCLT